MTAAGKMVTALRSDDDFADRLNFRYTTAMLVTFSILITSKQYVGQPIQCWTPEHFSKTHIQYAKDFCWIRNTYFLPYQSDIPREGQVCTTLMLHGSFTFNRVCIPRPWTRFIILSPATADELVFLITFVCYPPYVRKEGYIGLLVGVLQICGRRWHAPIGVKFCVMVHIGPGQIFSRLRGRYPRGSPKSEILGLNFGHVTVNISKTVSRSVTCQLELNISSTRAF